MFGLSYSSCNLCPNDCNVNREIEELGICGQSDKLKIAWAGLHKGEEPPISGDNGSGMIFFTGCSLHCRYCQNYQISTDNIGYEISEKDLSDIMLKLQYMGAHTLNLVTGTHFIPSIINALDMAKALGLKLPVVWNSSGYEKVSVLSILDEYIDFYLLDAKTLSSKTASVFCGTEEYVKYIIPVLDFLYNKKRNNKVIIRHLVFPGELESTIKFLDFFSENYRKKFLLSLMVQFVNPYVNNPCVNNPNVNNSNSISNLKDKRVLDNKITEKEYGMLLDLLDKYEIDGFFQIMDEEEEDKEVLWIPDFTKKNPFPEDFATSLNMDIS